MLFFISPPSHQVPIVQITPPPIERIFKKRQTDRYSIVVDSSGTGGDAHYIYELKLLAENPVAGSSDTKVAATFLDLRAKYGDMDAPTRKTFGAATYQFPRVGFPLDYSLAGRESSLVAPILSWYLPRVPLRPDNTFDIPDMVFDGRIHVTGVGSYRKSGSNSATIKLNLTFATPGEAMPAGTSLPTFNSTAVFNTKTGVLLSAEGEMAGFGGDMSFHIQKN